MGDPLHGGFGQSPKFPNPSNLLFLFQFMTFQGLQITGTLCDLQRTKWLLGESMTILEGDLRILY